MLAVHWTPVSNTGRILKNGIRKSKSGLFCFPLTGFKQLDEWWGKFFNQGAKVHRKKYSGIVFKIANEDFPARFGHWLTTGKDSVDCIPDLKTLTSKFRETILWRMGQELAFKDYDSQALTDRLNSIEFMTFTFEDYQIVLSRSIAPDRILKVISPGNEKFSDKRKNRDLPDADIYEDE